MVGVVILPEEIILKLKNNIQPQWKICFLSAIIVGFIAHLYKITNWLPNWDSLVFRYDAQNMLQIGRWFLPVASAPSSFYDLPWLTGLLAILFHAAGAVCICHIFAVRKKITAALIGAGVASFPTVTSVMLYAYVCDAYALSFLLSCLAAVFLVKQKPNYIVSVILITLSVGIYQAYISVTIMLLLCYLIYEALKTDTKFKTLLLKGVKYMVTGVIGMALYYLVLVIVLKVTNSELIEYQGFDTVASMSGFDIPGSLYTINEVLVNYFFDFSNSVSLFSVLNIVICILSIALFAGETIKRKLKFGNIIAICVCAILLPFGACALCFVNSSVDFHNLMKMGFFCFYLLFVLQYEHAEFKCVKLNVLKRWCVLLVTLLLIANHIVIANVSYHKLNIAYEKSIGTLVRIADRIEQTEGAEDCNKIAVLDSLEDSKAYSAILPPDITGTTDGYILRADDEIVGQSVLCSALNDYCGKEYSFVVGNEKETLAKKAKEFGLENWPNKNSICVIDDVIVIKLGD